MIPLCSPIVYHVIMNLVTSRDWRTKVGPSTTCVRLIFSQILRQMITIYKELAIPAYATICQILVFLDDADAVADILLTLLNGSEDEQLLAYQIGFDLYENGTQQFLKRVRAKLPAPLPQPKSEDEKETKSDTAMDVVRFTQAGPFIFFFNHVGCRRNLRKHLYWLLPKLKKHKTRKFSLLILQRFELMFRSCWLVHCIVVWLFNVSFL